MDPRLCDISGLYLGFKVKQEASLCCRRWSRIFLSLPAVSVALLVAFACIRLRYRCSVVTD